MTLPIAIISDLHGQSDVLKKLIANVFPAVREIWWLGDLFYSYSKDEKSIAESLRVMNELLHYSAKPCLYIQGNTDTIANFEPFFDHFEVEPFEIKQIGNDTLVLTHGHLYKSRESLVELAMSVGAQIAIYGHTHLPELSVKDDVVLINPGSPSLPRNETATPTYILFDPEKKRFQLIHFESGAILNELYYASAVSQKVK